MSHFLWMRPRLGFMLVSTAAMASVALSAAYGAEEKGSSMSYRETREFLGKHTDLIELTDDAGARVAVAPQWQGRVMTSTCGGLEGPSFGFVNRDFIEAGKPDLRINNYGGEDRFWLCPEGGQFSLWFKPGAKQALENWYTPPALNEGAWKVISQPNDPIVRMTANMKFQNASGTAFELDVARNVRLVGPGDFREWFGAEAATTMGKAGVRLVGYETANRITNRGPAFSKEKGLVSIWILGMMNAGPRTVILAPYNPGPESQLGPVVNSSYFGAVPPERLKVTPQAVLFRADGHLRSKIGLVPLRARGVLGSIDFQAGVLTLVHFFMPGEVGKNIYLNNLWDLPQANPYVGDIANAYNDGPNDLGKQLGAFYEIESVSYALPLNTGASLEHWHRTIHVQADAATLHKLAKEALGVDLEAVRKAMPMD